MSGLVERLRNQLEFWNSGGRFEAADRIEADAARIAALEAEVGELRGELDRRQKAMNIAAAHIKRERLRKKLAARAALEPKP